MRESLIDFIIVDYRTPELADRAAQTIHENAHVPANIVVVDAAKEGTSYAASIKLGLSRLGGEASPYLCALNADVECRDSQWSIVELFEKYGDVAVIGPRQVDEYGIVRHGGISGTNAAPVHRYWGAVLDEVEEHCSEPLLDCVTVSGSVYYVRRSVWDELGGFLDTRHYFEETWFSYLARHRGYRVCFSALSTWLHHWGQSPVTSEWIQEVFAESREIFRAACAREGIECD